MAHHDSNTGIIGGSFSLRLRGLLHRKPKDMDICGIPYKKGIRNFCKSLGIKLDFCNPDLHEYDEIIYKNRTIRIAKLKDVMYFKYRTQKKINENPRMIGEKHYKDIINVFRNLGEEKSKKLIEEINLPEEDKNVLINGMYIGINNTNEI